MSQKKAFVRYANNKAVPGSLIVRNQAPKVGVWKEIPYNLCCENNNTMNYKVYTALLSQTVTDPPIATVLENTLGGTPVWTRTSAGTYYCTLPGAFPTNKTFCLINNGYDYGNFGILFFGVTPNQNQLVIYYREPSGASIDFQTGGVNDVFVEVRVYP